MIVFTSFPLLGFVSVCVWGAFLSVKPNQKKNQQDVSYSPLISSVFKMVNRTLSSLKENQKRKEEKRALPYKLLPR
jgi:hypothetical protein